MVEGDDNVERRRLAKVVVDAGKRREGKRSASDEDPLVFLTARGCQLLHLRLAHSRPALNPGDGLPAQSQRVGGVQQPRPRALEDTALLDEVLQDRPALGNVLVNVVLRLADERVFAQRIVFARVRPHVPSSSGGVAKRRLVQRRGRAVGAGRDAAVREGPS